MKRLCHLLGLTSLNEETLDKIFETIPTAVIYEALITILQKDITHREPIDEAFILKTVSLMPFFHPLVEEHGIDTLKRACKHLSYEKYPEGSIIFQKGDRGSNFYIIVKGSVGVHTPEKEGDKKVFKEILELKAGDSFGELALINDKPRSATIICKEECHLAVLEKNYYLGILNEAEKKKIEVKIEGLFAFKFLKKVGRKILSHHHADFELEAVPLNKALYKEGEEPDHIYFVLSGCYKVQTTMNVPHEDNFDDPNLSLFSNGSRKSFMTRNVEIAILGKGEIIGIEDVVLERYRSTTVTCVEPGNVYKLSTHIFRRKMLENAHESFLRLLESYVKSREDWFTVRVNEVCDQVLKHKSLLLPTSSNKKDRKRSGSVPYPKALNQSAKNPYRINCSPLRGSVTDGKFEEPFPGGNEKISTSCYVTSLVDSELASPAMSPSRYIEKRESSVEKKLKIIVSEAKSQFSNDKSAANSNRRAMIQKSLDALDPVRSKTKTMSPPSSILKKNKMSLNKSFDKKGNKDLATMQLLSQGLFELNPQNKTFDSSNNQNNRTQKEILLPNIKGTSPQGLRYISSKPIKQTQKNVLDKSEYLAGKEKLLEELSKKSTNEPWDLQKHLLQVMHENNDLNRRSIALRQAGVTRVKIPTKRKPSETSDERKASSVDKRKPATANKTQKENKNTYVIFPLPKKNSSIIRPQHPKLVTDPQNESLNKSYSRNVKSEVFEIKGNPPENLVENLTKLNEELDGWKGPYVLLNKRLKRKFIRTQLANICSKKS